MRFSILILGLIFSVNSYSCDTSLRNYKFECEFQDKFNKLKTDFDKYNANPLRLKGYLIPHVLGVRDYNANKSEYLNHPIENLENNSDWTTWKRTQDYINKLNPIYLESVDITKLQSKILPNKSSGKLRIGNAQIKPKVSYSCDDAIITKDVVSLLKEYDLTSEEGYPLLSIEDIADCKDSKNFKSGKIIYYKNASVRSELKRWVVDYNDGLERFENGELLDISPYKYLADMRRWFMALSPYAEGNYNVAEALITYGAKRLHLPPLGHLKSGNEILLTPEENRKQVLQEMTNSLNFFEGCLFEIKTNLTSEECSSL